VCLVRVDEQSVSLLDTFSLPPCELKLGGVPPRLAIIPPPTSALVRCRKLTGIGMVAYRHVSVGGSPSSFAPDIEDSQHIPQPVSIISTGTTNEVIH
jgi:hypothetical protein